MGRHRTEADRWHSCAHGRYQRVRTRKSRPGGQGHTSSVDVGVGGRPSGVGTHWATCRAACVGQGSLVFCISVGRLPRAVRPCVAKRVGQEKQERHTALRMMRYGTLLHRAQAQHSPPRLSLQDTLGHQLHPHFCVFPSRPLFVSNTIIESSVVSKVQICSCVFTSAGELGSAKAKISGWCTALPQQKDAYRKIPTNVKTPRLSTALDD